MVKENLYADMGARRVNGKKLKYYYKNLVHSAKSPHLWIPNKTVALLIYTLHSNVQMPHACLRALTALWIFVMGPSLFSVNDSNISCVKSRSARPSISCEQSEDETDKIGVEQKLHRGRP